jgi:hypothetical protein
MVFLEKITPARLARAVVVPSQKEFGERAGRW